MTDDPLDLDTGLPARIAADAAVLAPLALSVARRLPASADTAKLARELGVDVAAINGALEQLVRRGHLIVEPDRDLRRTSARAGANSIFSRRPHVRVTSWAIASGPSRRQRQHAGEPGRRSCRFRGAMIMDSSSARPRA